MKKKLAMVMVGALVVALAVPGVAFAGMHGGQNWRTMACVSDSLCRIVQVVQQRVDVACGTSRPVEDPAAGVCAFVDADGDGVCDNYASGTCPGVGHGGGQGACGGFVDADGNGVCDNYAAGVCPGGHGGQGFGGGYVDADGDGTCDRYGSGYGCGNGGHGNHGGQGGCGWKGGRR